MITIKVSRLWELHFNAGSGLAAIAAHMVFDQGQSPWLLALIPIFLARKVKP